MNWLIFIINVLGNVFSWFFAPAIFAVIHFTILIGVLFVWYVERNAVVYKAKHLHQSDTKQTSMTKYTFDDNVKTAKPKKVGRFDFFEFALKGIWEE